MIPSDPRRPRQSRLDGGPSEVGSPSESRALACENDSIPLYVSNDHERLARRELELLGEDPHCYGLGENQRKNLAAFLDLLARMGALDRYLEPEELFVPSTYGLS